MTQLTYKNHTSDIVLGSDASDEDRSSVSSVSRGDRDEEAEGSEDEEDVTPVVIDVDNGGEGQDLVYSGERYSNPRKVALLISKFSQHLLQLPTPFQLPYLSRPVQILYFLTLSQHVWAASGDAGT
jgi:hypothetical protein